MNKSLYIIAEAAQGYEGSVEIAKLLVRGAVAAKADAIKFQVVFAKDLCEPGYEYYDLFKQLEMSLDEWKSIRLLAQENSIDFVVDVFGERAFELAKELNVDGIKLHSTTFFDHRLVRQVLALNKKTFISIGGITPEEIDQFVEMFNIKENKNITILYGYQAEPTPTDSNNLLRMNRLKDKVGCNIGFMDHSEAGNIDDIALSILALGLGVNVFEKHITLDRQIKLEDYVSGLEPKEFSDYVATLGRLMKALGKPELELTQNEKDYRGRAIKRVVVTRDITAGEIISEADVKLSRPANSGGVFRLEQVIDKKLTISLKQGDPVEEKYCHDVAK